MSQILTAVTNSNGQIVKAQSHLAKPGGAAARVVVQAGQKIILQVDGQSQTGSVPIMDKRPVLRKSGKDLAVDVDGKPVLLLVNFFGVKGASLSGDEWTFAPGQGLTLGSQGVLAYQGSDLAAVGVTGTGTGHKDLAAVGVSGTGTGTGSSGAQELAAVGMSGTNRDLAAVGVSGTTRDVAAVGMSGTNRDLAAVGVSGTTRDVAAVGVSGTNRDLAAVGVSGTTSDLAAVGLSGTKLAALAAGVSLLPLLASLGGNGGDNETSSSMSGSVVAGPVTEGLQVEIYKAENGKLVLLGTADVASGGKWSYTVKGYTGPVLVKVVDANDKDGQEGGNYKSELTGETVDLKAALFAAINLKAGANTVNITPVTTIAAMKAGVSVDAAGTVVASVPSDFNAEKVDSSNAAVAQALSLSNIVTDEVKTTVDIEGKDSLGQANQYGQILAAIEGMGGNSQIKLEELAALLHVSAETAELTLAGKQELISGASNVELSRGKGQEGLTSAVLDLLTLTNLNSNLTLDHLGVNNIITDQNRVLALRVQAPQGTTDLQLHLNGSPIDPAEFTLSNDGAGVWNITLSASAWTYGAYELTVQTVGAERVESVSKMFRLIDTLAAAAPVVGLRLDSGALDNDGVTSDGTVNVSGLELGATWQYSTDNGSTWQIGVGSSFDLAPGSYAAGDIKVKQTDMAGNTSGVGLASAIVVDVAAPQGPSMQLRADTGAAGDDGVTSDGTMNVAGLEADATWEYSTDAGDSWQLGSGTSFVLQAGSYAEGAVRVRQTDLAGNHSDTSISTQSLTVDASPSATPSLALAVDTGADATDGVTSLGLINVTGLVLGDAWAYSTDRGTTWNAGSGTGFLLGDGTYAAGSILVRQTDLAGNVSQEGSYATAITVQSSAGSSLTLTLASDTGVSATDCFTQRGEVLVGGLEAGASWEYSVDAGATWAAGAGTSFVLSEGAYPAGTLQVRQTTLAGVTSDPSYSMCAFHVDAQAPSTNLVFSLSVDSGRVDSDGITNVGTVAVAGLEAGATWEYSIDAGASWQTGSGTELTLPAGSYAAGAVQVRQTDLAGNTSLPASAASAYRVITTLEPAKTVGITRLQDDFGVVQGFVARNGRTDDANPEIQGSLSRALSAGDVVKIYDGSEYLGDVAIFASTGLTWEFTETRTLADGHVAEYTAVIEDIAGNRSAHSTVFNVTINRLLPVTIAVDDGGPEGVSGIASNAGSSDAFRDLSEVSGGAGNDTISVSGQANSRLTVLGQAGNDSIQFIGENLGNFTVNAGSGNDTVNLSRLTTGPITLALGEGDDRVAAAAMVTGLAVWDGAGADSIVLGSGNDTVHVDISTGFGNDSFTAGQGTDVLSYADYTAALNVNVWGNTTTGGKNGAGMRADILPEKDYFYGFESIVGGAGDDVFLITNDPGGLSVQGGAGNDALRYQGSTIQTDLSVRLTSSGSTLAGTVAAGDLVDVFTEIERVTTGAGNDAIYVSSAQSVTVAGGAGNDTITLAALSKTENGGGLAQATISGLDFTVDVLSLQGFWDAGVIDALNLNSYMRMSGNNLQVDMDGTGGGTYGWTTVANLSNLVNGDTLANLYANGHFIISA